MSNVYIYTLSEPDNEAAVRYVGRSKNPRWRVYMHYRETHNQRKHEWLSGLKSKGQEAIVNVIGTVSENEARRVEENEIARHVAMGCDLVNALTYETTGEGSEHTHADGPTVRLSDVKMPHDGKMTVRFSSEDYEMIERVAKRKRTPAATLIRVWAMQCCIKEDAG